MVAAFRARRDIIVDGLNAIPGVSCLNPKGAFYVFPNITGTGKSSREFADFLLEEHGVAGIGRHLVRQVRRRLPAPQLRQLRRKPPQSPRPHPLRRRAGQRLTKLPRPG